MSCCAAGNIAWTKLEDARQADELLTAIPYCCRNGAPGRLLFAMSHSLLRPEYLAQELEDAWSAAEVPEMELPQSLWTLLFEMAGYSENGRPCERPEGKFVAYRGSLWRYRRRMSWTIDKKQAEWFAWRNGLRSGEYGLVFRAEIDNDAVLARGGRSSEREIIVNSSKLPPLTKESVVATFGPADEAPVRNYDELDSATD
jgi:hypothetical protein